jgi:hypothetical protein
MKVPFDIVDRKRRKERKGNRKAAEKTTPSLYTAPFLRSPLPSQAASNIVKQARPGQSASSSV